MSQFSDVYIQLTEKELTIQLLSDSEIKLVIYGLKESKAVLLKPGNLLKYRI